MKLVHLLLCCFFLLPVSQKRSTAEKITTEPPAAFHFNATLGKPIFERMKIPSEADTNQLKQSGWYASAMRNIAQAEYHIHKAENTNTFSSPNRHNNLRFKYDENGFTVQPRTTSIPVGKIDNNTRPDEIKYKELPDWKIAFNLDKKQIGEGTWQVTGNKAEYVTNNITVQYINNEQGMRQNFIVRSPLTASDELKIHFSVETNLQQRFNSDRLQFVSKKTGIVLNYEQLKVWDANGKPLEAAFEKSNRDYCIHVNTKNAIYPVTIDPISTTPVAMLESNQADAQMGNSVSSAGDVNGDGYSDVIVGAPYYDNGQTNEGAAFVYHGSASGINPIAAARLESNQYDARMGCSVSSAGDVNGDGYSDVIVGAYVYNNGQTDEGAAFIFHGSATGIIITAATRVESNQYDARMGYSVSCAGDVNGDGYSDVIVGAYGYDNGEGDEGAAFIYHGSATGIISTAATMVESNDSGAWFGYSVSGAGDVNGDGYSDVIVGAYLYGNYGGAFVYYGSDPGLSTTAVLLNLIAQFNANWGFSVASAGDVNGDGYSDVIVGISKYDGGQADGGLVAIHHGSASGIRVWPAGWLQGNQANAQMGWSVASAGDVNGDGYGDVIVGACYYDNGQTDEGAAFLYMGSASGISTTAAARLESNQADARMGCSVASAGDVNGDGYSDIIVGAFSYDNGQNNEGAAFIYHGAANNISTIPAVMVESNQINAFMGNSVAGAGDVNGDGYSDVIVGASQYDNGQNNEGAAFIYHGSANGIGIIPAAMVESNQLIAYMGTSVAGAGDVNGDGYSDVIVGASQYDNGQNNEGAAFIYYGSVTGINTTAMASVEGNRADASIGTSVAGAGDVNGDGYSDVIVGANLYSNGQTWEGAAFMYHGSATGINTTAAAQIESNQVNAYMGVSVAGAGDVNGDGYSDVIVGAIYYDNGQNNEGAAFIHHGSASGINTTAAARVESHQVNAYMGVSVAGAGDVNGDGYSDVIVGASGYNNGETGEGVAFVYHGSAVGINTTAAMMIESNQDGANLGSSVAGAGDVNGDGYSDVIVGASYYDNGETNEGAAFIYHGSTSGINTTAAAMVESNQADAYFGRSVASAGDVNGDGYSDVIVGASRYDNGQTDEGAAFVYYGNSSGNNKRNNLNVYNSHLVTPINSSNFTAGSFGAGLFAKSFLGRNKGKLVWETKLHYNPYSGTPITNSALYTSQQPGYTDLGLTGTELKNLVAKQAGKYTKIRARVKYDLVTAITGQVYGPWRYVPAQIAGASLGVLPVDLISFKAAWLQKGKTAQIDFTTDNESAICCYEIEKSTDGVLFNKIGKVDAINSTTRHTYTFTDYTATGTKQYYRLKIIHTSETVEYSSIQLLQHNVATEILVFPNPATNVLQLQLNSNYATMNVQIINSGGQVVKQYARLSATNQVLQIPVNALASGTYFLYLQSGSEKQVLQFMKE